MPYHPRYSMLLYSASSLLDVADGYAARALNQSSEFGAVLDMVTDRYGPPAPTPTPGTDAHVFGHRCATSCLLCYLASTYPEYALLFQFLITLDFSSHYMHMCRSDACSPFDPKALITMLGRYTVPLPPARGGTNWSRAM